MWVRGLKLQIQTVNLTVPYVAPYVGAWIETLAAQTFAAVQASHPMWVRGLKLIMRDKL